jgi:ferredoxin
LPTITVEGEKSFEAPEGKKLVLAIEDAGIDILHRCGGQARCTTCRIEVLEGEVPPISEAETEALEDEDWIAKFRLSCQLRCQNDLTVRVIKRSHVEEIDPGPRPED